MDETRFVTDYALFRIARQLRLLGYDVSCNPLITGEAVVKIAQSEGRTLITGRSRWLPHIRRLADLPTRTRLRRVVISYNSDGESEYESDPEVARPLTFVEIDTTKPFQDQLQEVVQKCGLQWRPHRVFTRCVTCNVDIVEVTPASVEHLVNATVFRTYKRLYQCPQCTKVYWGMDDGVLVNYKALRTVEHLRQICGVTARLLRRHFMSFPRCVKIRVFEYLTSEERIGFGTAFPALADLLGAVTKGTAGKFVPDSRRRA